MNAVHTVQALCDVHDGTIEEFPGTLDEFLEEPVGRRVGHKDMFSRLANRLPAPKISRAYEGR